MKPKTKDINKIRAEIAKLKDEIDKLQQEITSQQTAKTVRRRAASCHRHRPHSPLGPERAHLSVADVKNGLVVRLRLDRRLFDLQGRPSRLPGRLADHDPTLSTALGRLERRGHLLFGKTL